MNGADRKSQETLPKEVLEKMYAGGSLHPKYPVITPNDLKEADGIIIGAPTRSVIPSLEKSWMLIRLDTDEYLLKSLLSLTLVDNYG